MSLVISGKVVPLDREDPDAAFKGRVFLDDSGAVERVVAGNAAAPDRIRDGPVVDVGDAFVLPGLIDLHNHIGYNTLPLWAEPKQKTAFAHHDSWTNARQLSGLDQLAREALAAAAPEALLAYVQLRALVGGTTAIQGWPSANRESSRCCATSMTRRRDGSDRNLIYTSTLTKKPLDLARWRRRKNAGARGSSITVPRVSRDRSCCASSSMPPTRVASSKTFIGIHCNAVTGADWKRWAKSQGRRRRVVAVLEPLALRDDDRHCRRAQAGVSICLGSDWGPSGTKNVQGEIKVAKLASQQLGLGLTDRELVAMVTTNPGDALSRCWKKTIGRLTTGRVCAISRSSRHGNQAGMDADRRVDRGRRDAGRVNGGIARYGDAALMTKAAADSSRARSPCGAGNAASPFPTPTTRPRHGLEGHHRPA